MLNNVQVKDLASRMGLKLEGVYFKSELKDMKMKPNMCYIINLEDEYDEDGEPNEGSHYTCFQYNKYPKKDCRDEYVYFDSYGIAPPDEVLEFCGVSQMPHSIIDIQSLMCNACGWFALAFLYYINVFHGRSMDLYRDAETFTSLFNDLNKTNDFKYNEWLLKQFFKSPNSKSTTLEDVGFKFVATGTNVASGIADIDSIDSEA
jgi:hypothetical protein